MKHHRYASLAGLLVASTAHAQTMPATPPASPAPVVNYEYDAEGSVTKTVQAPGVTGFGFTTTGSYDSLNRLKEVIDAKSGKTQMGYDSMDRPTQVTDPRNLITKYNRNGFGNVTSVVSPDTGTANQTYDANWNLKTRTDSRGVLSTYSYDALNRVTSIVYTKSGLSSITQNFAFDQTGTGFAYGIGRLTSLTYPQGYRRFVYNPYGEVVSDVQRFKAATGANTTDIEKTVGYTFLNGDMSSITYPSGRKLTFTLDRGRVTAISLAKDATSTATPLINNIKYFPFGGPTNWQWQMASGTQAHDKVIDLSARMVRYPLGGYIRDLTFDAANRITSYKHYDAATKTATTASNALNQTFGYDELSRLKTVNTASGNWTINYDANGNRTSVQVGSTTNTYTVAATSNKVTSITNPSRTITYDNAGNTTSDGQFTATYDLSNRMVTLTKAGVTTTFAYNGFGQRVRKFNANGTTLFVYSPEGHLLGEYSATGAPLREYVWFSGVPIAMFTPDPANAANPPLIYYIHTDHLNTPRVVVDKNNNVRWRWMADPFGVAAPETNPSSLGAFTQNLRFPGQYADAESGLFHNWHRDYNASTGRYVQSDPIGLDGGINTYAYTYSNPLMFVDPNGLWALGDPLPQGMLDFGAGMGDVILFGQGQRLRDLFDVDGGVDPCSDEYGAGKWAGVGMSFATGLAGGLKAAGAKGAGKEFSHWIPNRMGGPRSLWNGNYVPKSTHALSDPYRYRFMPRDWKAQNPMPNVAAQQWVRIPNAYKGGAAGGAYGAGGAGLSNDCTCQR